MTASVHSVTSVVMFVKSVSQSRIEATVLEPSHP